MNNNGRSNKSLCEMSLTMVANIVKLSSFSIAKMSLGTAPKNLPSLIRSNTVLNKPLMPQFSGSLKSQEPQSVSKPVSYLIEPPVEGKGSLYVMHEEKGVDRRTVDYIRKVHEKNRLDSKEYSMTLPPPPRGAM